MARATPGSTSIQAGDEKGPSGRSSASNTRGSIRPSKKPPACRRLCAASSTTWSTKSNARPAAAAGCATTPRPCGSAAARWTTSAARRWGICSSRFHGWKMNPSERKVAGELLREVRNRVQFLVDVGLEYLTLGRAGADPFGRRSSAHSTGQPGGQRIDRRAVRARRADDWPAPARQPASDQGPDSICAIWATRC